MLIFTDHALRELVVLMTDPAIAFLPDDPDYAPYHRGEDLDVYLKAENGSDFLGLVWPGELRRALLFDDLFTDGFLFIFQESLCSQVGFFITIFSTCSHEFCRLVPPECYDVSATCLQLPLPQN
jgi:hypothetical protein